MAYLVISALLILSIIGGLLTIISNRDALRFVLIFTLKFSLPFTIFFSLIGFLSSQTSNTSEFELENVASIFLLTLLVFGVWSLLIVNRDDDYK